MYKQEKIISLSKAMTVKTKDDKTEFTCFTDEAPEELKSLFLRHYEVRDMDYKIFSDACDIMSELYGDAIQENDDDAIDEEEIYNRADGQSSVYTAERLSYLGVWNQDEITEHVKDLGFDIATACAYWYDEKVKEACFIIKNWVEEVKE